MYNVHRILVNINVYAFSIIGPALACTLIYILLLDPASLVIEKKGLRTALIISCITLIIGALLTLLVNQSYYYLLIGI